MRKFVDKNLEKYYINNTRDILVQVAQGKIIGKKGKGFIEYNELMGKMGGPGRAYIGGVLEEVACCKKKEDEPILTAIVIHAHDGKPGDSFWKIRCLPLDKKVAQSKDKKIFWEKECDKVWNYHW
jgi:hypothetical protein